MGLDATNTPSDEGNHCEKPTEPKGGFHFSHCSFLSLRGTMPHLKSGLNTPTTLETWSVNDGASRILNTAHQYDAKTTKYFLTERTTRFLE